VLRETAERLQRCLRNSDTVARLGGDEFAALLPRVRTSTDLASIACKMLAAFNAPFMIDGRELVKVMISIAQVLKMELVAEGVETQEQADCLLTNNCPIAQGYLFGKPMPYAAFEALMASSGC